MDGAAKTVSLREARLQADRTQEEVAAALRPPISVMTLRRWEQGGHVPKRSNPEWWLSQLAEIYGVPVESLMNGSCPEPAA